MDKATDCLETKTAVRGTRLNPFANLKQSPHAAGNCFPGHATFHIHVQCLCMSPEGGDLQAWISDSVVPPHGKLFLTLIPGCIQTLLSLLTFLHLLRHELQSPRNQRIKKQRPEGCLGVAVSELLSDPKPSLLSSCLDKILHKMPKSMDKAVSLLILPWGCHLSSGRDVWNRNSEVVRPKKTEAQRGKRY
ncbi:PREDICTED: uncharacterized protein LOC108448259 isoform X3 [Corvus brachyrhynchos]|uniref:uncharacterized protein LOC108448259 isoform X3 n=1 Tax=Corvus brachyrhynchos TaxID=85066 RepID=UPI000816724E|nr:PREDICTED: uncharacterized protein LOC108448259 isoform X3 [Corvus brachyrhynchos]